MISYLQKNGAPWSKCLEKTLHFFTPLLETSWFYDALDAPRVKCIEKTLGFFHATAKNLLFCDALGAGRVSVKQYSLYGFSRIGSLGASGEKDLS
jgi:hypothetical protein